jgi:carbon storage regulator
MLVLSRRPGQSILIGKDIEIVVLGSDGVQVRVGIRAPREVTVLRRELLKQVEEENRRASTGTLGVSVESLGAALGQIGGELAPKAANAPPAETTAPPASSVRIRKLPRAGAA